LSVCTGENYTTTNKEKQSTFPVRSAYPDRQGTSSIFSQKARKNLHSQTLDRLDFCRCHFAAENGEQDFTTLPPACVRSSLTAKPSALVRLLVGFAEVCPRSAVKKTYRNKYPTDSFIIYPDGRHYLSLNVFDWLEDEKLYIYVDQELEMQAFAEFLKTCYATK